MFPRSAGVIGGSHNFGDGGIMDGSDVMLLLCSGGRQTLTHSF